MDLKDSDLIEMGFTKGQCMNIIQLFKVRIKIIECMDEFYGIHCTGKQRRERF